MNGLALCAGYGGLELGIERVFPESRTVCYVEGEAFAVQHLVKKMEEGRLDYAPIWSNVKTFDGIPWRGKVDLLSGGFPCQPYSSAGKQMGEEDPRDLWPDFVRIIGEVRPGFLFLENVPNVVNMRLSQIVLDLDKLGYHASWCVVSASQVGAPHRRRRWFLFAVRHTNSNTQCSRRFEDKQSPPEGEFDFEGVRGNMADTNNQGMGPCSSRPNGGSNQEGGERNYNHSRSGKNAKSQGLNEPSNMEENVSNTFKNGCSKIGELQAREQKPGGKISSVISQGELSNAGGKGLEGTISQKERGRSAGYSRGMEEKWGGRFNEWWKVEPSMGRLADGASDWVDKLRLLGNGVVPQQAAYAFQILGERLACGIVENRTPKD